MLHNLVEGYIGTDAGYLKNFSYSIHDTFYHIYCGLDVDVHAYRKSGLLYFSKVSVAGGRGRVAMVLSGRG